LLHLQDEGFVSLMVAKVRGPGAGPRIVELSRVERGLARDIEVKEAFLAEARAAGRIRHPNFVPPIDTLLFDGDLYGATEFALGVRLDELWRAAAAEHYEIPLHVSLRIVLDTLAGLSALHANAVTGGTRSIVHGDVAPTNIFITNRGETRLVHSGLSTVTSRPSAIGKRNTRLCYKAPEQLRTDVNAVPIGPTADVFAAGVLLWEVLQGARLFDDDSGVEVVEHILYGQIPPLEPGGNRFMPIALLPLVSNALERNPDVRTQSAAEMAFELERAPGVRFALEEEVAAVVDHLLGPLMERRRTRIEELVAQSAGAKSEGSLRPVAGPQRRSMRTPVGFVYGPPPSSTVGRALTTPTPSSAVGTPFSQVLPGYETAGNPPPSSFRTPDNRGGPPISPRTPLSNRVPVRASTTTGRFSASPTGRFPASPTGRFPAARSTSPGVPSSSRPTTIRDARVRRQSGGGWLFYLAIGAVAGLVLFTILRRLIEPTGAGIAASEYPPTAVPAAPPPMATTGKALAPELEQLAKPSEALAPTEEAVSPEAAENQGSSSASSPTAATPPSAPVPPRPVQKAQKRPDIPEGI
jgi:serine/threonine-protein kinase